MPLATGFLGTPEAAVPPLERLLDSDHRVLAVATAPDRPKGRGMELAASPVKQRAVAAGIPVLQPPSLRTPEAQAELAAAGADVFVVCAYGLILPPAVLDEPRFGCVTVRLSLLPACRGGGARAAAGPDRGAPPARRRPRLAGGPSGPRRGRPACLGPGPPRGRDHRGPPPGRLPGELRREGHARGRPHRLGPARGLD